MFRKLALFSAFAIVAAIPVVAQQAPAPPPAPAGAQRGAPGGGRGGQQAPQAIKQVKPGFYMVTGGGGNSSVRVASDGIILVDTKNLGDAFQTALVDQIKTVSTQPVKYVFITHHHQDHSGNIGKFVEAGAQVIAHENLKTNLVTYAPAQGKPANPNVTYAKDHVVRLAGATAEAHYYGRGHTNGDTFVYFPDLRIVSTGDMFVATAPNADYPFGGSVIEWSKALDSLLKLDFDTVIPGHGNDPLTKADVQAFKGKIDTIIARASELVKKGTPKAQLLADLKTDDIGWNINNQQWSAPARLDPFYDELSKLK